jgi:hypothetical protein
MSDNLNKSEQSHVETKLVATLSPKQNIKKRKFGRITRIIPSLDFAGILSRRGGCIPVKYEEICKYLCDHDSEPCFARLEITDKDGRVFAATLKPESSPSSEKSEKSSEKLLKVIPVSGYKAFIGNELFTLNETEKIIHDFVFKGVTPEDLKDQLNDSVVDLVSTLQGQKNFNLKLQKKRDLINAIQKQLSATQEQDRNLFKRSSLHNNLVTLHNQSHPLFRENFLPDYSYINSDRELQDFLKSDFYSFFYGADLSGAISKQAPISEIEKSVIKAFADIQARVQKILIKRKKRNLPLLDNELKNNLNHALLDLHSRLVFCNAVQLQEIIVKFDTFAHRVQHLLIYKRKGNTAKELCWSVLWALRQIYKDYFCTTKTAAKNAEQNIQHIGGANDEYGDKDKSKGQLLEFVYRIMLEVQNKTKMKIWRKDTFGKNLYLTRDDAINCYESSKQS